MNSFKLVFRAVVLSMLLSQAMPAVCTEGSQSGFSVLNGAKVLTKSFFTSLYKYSAALVNKVRGKELGFEWTSHDTKKSVALGAIVVGFIGCSLFLFKKRKKTVERVSDSRSLDDEGGDDQEEVKVDAEVKVVEEVDDEGGGDGQEEDDDQDEVEEEDESDDQALESIGQKIRDIGQVVSSNDFRSNEQDFTLEQGEAVFSKLTGTLHAAGSVIREMRELAEKQSLSLDQQFRLIGRVEVQSDAETDGEDDA